MLIKHEKGRLLADYTSFKIGGPVFCWFEPEDFSEVLEVISIAKKDGKPMAIIGRGSNILAQDNGFDGVVVNLGRGFDYIEEEEDAVLRVGAATFLSSLVAKCTELGLSGCEFLSGIPGSLGGAIFMNAGVRDMDDLKAFKEIKDVIVNVEVLDLDDGRRKVLKRDDIDFSYRSSGLKGKCILGARIKLEKCRRDIIKKRIDSFMKSRAWIQKIGFPTAGSVFKNPDSENPAGRLIEECGLKGRRSGGAEISSVHANFIVNRAGASARDVLDLIELARNSVKSKFGIELELELKIL
jgi:UDP-N-acetylmuramate dehydrogenase